MGQNFYVNLTTQLARLASLTQVFLFTKTYLNPYDSVFDNKEKIKQIKLAIESFRIYKHGTEKLNFHIICNGHTICNLFENY